jgi:hypothetical protein
MPTDTANPTDGFTLPSYAAVQVWAKAVGKAGTLDAGIG